MLISAKAKVKRVERSKDLQDWLRENPNTVIIFSDKKIFTGKVNARHATLVTDSMFILRFSL